VRVFAFAFAALVALWCFWRRSTAGRCVMKTAMSPSRCAARPFLKWVGGKGRLLSQLAPLLPDGVQSMRHLEPFAGGAAMFFASGSERARLSDLNGDLMRTYAAVRDDVEGVIAHLSRLMEQHGVGHYYGVRDDYNRGAYACDAELAAVFVYLNKTCFNGLYRVNRSGCFNVPIGRSQRPPVADAESLRTASARLRGVELGVGSFECVLEHVRAGDFVYLDPPYDPLSKTSSFQAYTGDGFTRGDQVRLREVFDELSRRGVLAMLSNSDTSDVRALYRSWSAVKVLAQRSVNSAVTRRGAVSELVIRNYA